jgi:ParB family chromosome partitioning protein
MTINISQIKINEGRRSIDREKVKELAGSIQEVGLLNPVTITANNVLIAGAHRIEAVKLLGRKHIEANIVDISGLKVELAEIDENLIRNDLHYTVRGEYFDRRKVIYEMLYPATKRGAVNQYTKSANPNKSEQQKSFTQDISEKLGVSRDTIENEIKIAKNLSPEVKETVRGIDLSKTDALKLAHMEPEKQKTIIGKIASGKAKSVEEALKDKPHVSQATGNTEWYTPPEYIEAARKVLGAIDLDPASTVEANKVIKAERFFTVENDGLNKNWKGRVWLNPPYASSLIAYFVQKLSVHYAKNEVTEAIVLVNNATETIWFNTLIKNAAAVVFPKSRVKFQTSSGGAGAPLQGQAFIYLGKNPEYFIKIFKPFGWGAIPCGE